MSAHDDALRIWRAGVDAVRGESLVRRAVQRVENGINVCGQAIQLPVTGRLAVVGGGKAGAGMAAGLEKALGDWPVSERRSGWLNVPADCVQPTQWIHLHAGRPAGMNSPTAEGVAGSERILELVGSLGPEDVCLVLLSGGGSALLPAPVAGITLADKQAVTKLLSERGATIDELNCVRRSLSRFKGGGLLRACRAGTVVALVISDVVGDPLETIASGPLIPNPTSRADARAILERLAPDRTAVPDNVWRVLSQTEPTLADAGSIGHVRHHVIGNNRTACEAAAGEARRLGYDVIALRPNERGIAKDVGVRLARECRQRRDARVGGKPLCLITGGEPVVQLAATDGPQKGGRNQELVLAAVEELWKDGLAEITFLSGGTDGEDGPTDAAGAIADADLLSRARRLHLVPGAFLRVNNSYEFFAACGGLLLTGPTHTNVMDLRVALVGEAPPATNKGES